MLGWQQANRQLPMQTEVPAVPSVPAEVHLPNGSRWEFEFVTVACKVAKPVGKTRGPASAGRRRGRGRTERISFAVPAVAESNRHLLSCSLMPWPLRPQLATWPLATWPFGSTRRVAHDSAEDPLGTLPRMFDRHHTEWYEGNTWRTPRNVRFGDACTFVLRGDPCGVCWEL